MKERAAPLASLRFWKAFGITMRPYLLFISGISGMTGFSDGPSLGALRTSAAFLVFFLSYGFGQALTDCFQMDTDAISSPYRPLVKGAIRRKDVLLVSLLGLAAGCMVLFSLHPLTLVFGALAVSGLATYTYFKKRWWAGPFYNAWIVALLPLLGKLAATGSRTPLAGIFESGIIIPVMASVFLSYANFVLMGYFKDISADRATGYRTFVVVWGWERAARLSTLIAILSCLTSGMAVMSVLSRNPAFSPSWISVFVFLAAMITLVSAQAGIHRVRDEKMAFKPIANVVRGFILLHGAEMCALKPAWAPAFVLYYAAFEWILRKRPMKEQV